jgi:RimJ/RimL family protein N-acetyltransferase
MTLSETAPALKGERVLLRPAREFVSELYGQGLGREITRLVAHWRFQTLGLHRIELEVLTSNERAIRCYEAVGFRREGVRRQAELYPDGWKDFLYMSLLASDSTGTDGGAVSAGSA